jgi:hypothetical protein
LRLGTGGRRAARPPPEALAANAFMGNAASHGDHPARPFCAELDVETSRGLFRDVSALRSIYCELRFRAMLSQFPGPLRFDRAAYSGLEGFAERFKNSQDVAAYARLFDSAGAPHYGARYPGSTGFPGTDGPLYAGGILKTVICTVTPQYIDRGGTQDYPPNALASRRA